MHILTAEEVNQQPGRLLADAQRGQPDIVTVEGEPAMLTLPLGHGAGSSAERVELGITLYERDLVSLGLAAKVAGLGYSQMIDELGGRGIAVVRYSTADMDEELELVRSLGGRR